MIHFAQNVLDINEDNSFVNKLTFISTSLAFLVIEKKIPRIQNSTQLKIVFVAYFYGFGCILYGIY